MSAISIATAFIKAREGCKLTAYRDIANVLTIGYGETKGVVEGSTITQAQADENLAKRIVRLDDLITRTVNFPLSDNERAACMSLIYNIGEEAWRHSSVRSWLNTPDKARAADAILLWNKATDVNGHKFVVAGLVNRRHEERVLFLTPDIPV